MISMNEKNNDNIHNWEKDISNKGQGRALLVRGSVPCHLGTDLESPESIILYPLPPISIYSILIIKNEITILCIKNQIYDNQKWTLPENISFFLCSLFFRHNLMLCRNPSFIVWNQCVFAQYNAFVTCYALNKIVKEMKALWCIMHLGRETKCLLSGFSVQWPLIQTVADKALTFINYHHLYYHCHLNRNHQHHQPLHHHHHPYRVCKLLPEWLGALFVHGSKAIWTMPV